MAYFAELAMNKSVLIIAFHFPPIASSSGMQRALKTVRYLRESGWNPIVLTVNPRAYESTTTGQLAEIPEDVPVHRAFCLDSKRHFGIRGRYLSFTSWPDPWVSWWPAAVYSGLRLIRQHKPSIIWSTFPITTTNLVALRLAKSSNLPWVADFRDPMSMEGYPSDPMRFRCARWIEQQTVAHARRVVFTAEHTRKMYAERYPQAAGNFELIPNGYDEANFPDPHTVADSKTGDQLTIVHSGAMQPNGRDPTNFFEALKILKHNGDLDALRIRVVFRACGFAERYRELAEKTGVSDLLKFPDYLPYEDAIREMMSADGLMLFQGTVYNHAVPAKLYEYLYARKPIFAMVDQNGETSTVLRNLGVSSTSGFDDVEETAANFKDFVVSIRNRSHELPKQSAIEPFSRHRQVARLSRILEEESGI